MPMAGLDAEVVTHEKSSGSGFEIDDVTVTGMETFLPFETNYLAGKFDEETIIQ